MAITFQQARQAVAAAWPGGGFDIADVAQHGYETEADWLMVLLPERAGARVPAVSKQTGAVRWIYAYSPEYSEEHPVGVPAHRP